MKLRSIIAAGLLLAFATALSAQATEEYKKLLDGLSQKRSTVSPREFWGSPRRVWPISYPGFPIRQKRSRLI
jgi:hypothetical protein